jgi:hypothetical protein
MAAGVIGIVATAAVGGYVAGTRITSPAEVASRTAAPEPAPILVPVEQRVLSTDVVTRGTGRFGSPQKLSAAASALKQNPGLVASLPLVGAEFGEGAVAISASGRPVFVLAGSRPMSRDLGPGLSGDDVRQLEESLVRLGFDAGAVDGVYDEATAAAVSAWYTANGYAPFEATSDQLAEIRARETDLSTARADELAAPVGTLNMAPISTKLPGPISVAAGGLVTLYCRSGAKRGIQLRFQEPSSAMAILPTYQGSSPDMVAAPKPDLKRSIFSMSYFWA